MQELAEHGKKLKSVTIQSSLRCDSIRSRFAIEGMLGLRLKRLITGNIPSKRGLQDHEDMELLQVLMMEPAWIYH